MWVEEVSCPLPSPWTPPPHARIAKDECVSAVVFRDNNGVVIAVAVRRWRGKWLPLVAESIGFALRFS